MAQAVVKADSTGVSSEELSNAISDVLDEVGMRMDTLTVEPA